MNAYIQMHSDIFFIQVEKLAHSLSLSCSEQLNKRFIYYFIRLVLFISSFLSLYWIGMRDDAWRKVWEIIGISFIRMHTDNDNHTQADFYIYLLCVLNERIKKERKNLFGNNCKAFLIVLSEFIQLLLGFFICCRCWIWVWNFSDCISSTSKICSTRKGKREKPPPEGKRNAVNRGK